MQVDGSLRAVIDDERRDHVSPMLNAASVVRSTIEDVAIGDAASADSWSKRDWPALQGPHNAQNAAAAIAACRARLGEDAIDEGLRTYPGLPHRMERVREKDGVIFVNDSKATNPTATAPALAAFERIRWICGGQAKTDNLDECAPHFGHVATAYTIGEAAELFAAAVKSLTWP